MRWVEPGTSQAYDVQTANSIIASSDCVRREIADAIAAEWEAQQDDINPLTMPLTRFANSVVEAVVERVDAVTDDMAKYFETDLLFYRAGHPEALVAREAAFWDPVLAWAANDLGAHFILSEGIVHVTQPEQAIKAARGVFSMARSPLRQGSGHWSL